MFEEGVSACSMCAAALSGRRLLALQNPSRATFAHAEQLARAELDAKLDESWREHQYIEGEIARIDYELVEEESAHGALGDDSGCLAPLASLMEMWIRKGVLRTTPTICAQ